MNKKITLERISPTHRTRLAAIQQLVPAIWPHLSGTPYPWEAVMEFVDAGGSGALYAILAGRELVGITGWYWRIENPTNAGLRWTGIAPTYRRRGYFRDAVAAVQSDVAKAKPQVQSLSEIIPRRRAAELLPAFRSLGFEEVPDFMDERSATIHGTGYLADGILVAKEMDPASPKIADLMEKNPVLAEMFATHFRVGRSEPQDYAPPTRPFIP